MKKLFVLIFVLFMFPITLYALENDSYIDWQLDRTVFLHKYQNGKENIENLAMITANGKIAYCIEPGVMADKGSYYSSTLNISDTPLKDKDIKLISLIGYYGYGYKNHNTKEYYMATQELIWRYMGVEEIIWSDAKYNGNIINIQSYKDEIMNLVNSYEIAPKFNIKDEYIINDEIVLKDLNNVLHDYEIDGKKDNVTLTNNEVKIRVKKEDNEFTLRRKKNGNNPVFYYKEGYQTIGTFEYAYDYKVSYKIRGSLGKIVLEKYDYDTKSKYSLSKEATLSNAVYGLYDENNNLIEEKSTDALGNLIFDDLYKGKYYIKEITPSKGYTLDDNIYEINIDSNNKEQLIKSYEKIIENKIIINKVLDEEENGLMIPEENIEFGIYDSNNNLYSKYKTNEEGMIKITLPYGNYIIRQLTSPEGITKIEDKYFTVDKNDEEKVFTLVNRRIKQQTILPKTGKTFNFVPFIITQIIFLIIGIYEKKRV